MSTSGVKLIGYSSSSSSSASKDDGSEIKSGQMIPSAFDFQDAYFLDDDDFSYYLRDRPYSQEFSSSSSSDDLTDSVIRPPFKQFLRIWDFPTTILNPNVRSQYAPCNVILSAAKRRALFVAPPKKFYHVSFLEMYREHIRLHLRKVYMSNRKDLVFVYPSFDAIFPLSYFEGQGIVYAIWRVFMEGYHSAWDFLNVTRDSVISVDKLQVASYYLPPHHQYYPLVLRVYVPFPNRFMIDSILITPHDVDDFYMRSRALCVYDLNLIMFKLHARPFDSTFAYDCNLPIPVALRPKWNTFEQPSYEDFVKDNKIKIDICQYYNERRRLFPEHFYQLKDLPAHINDWQMQMFKPDDSKDKDNVVDLPPTKFKGKFISRDVANQRIMTIMNNNVSQRTVTSYDNTGVPNHSTTNYKKKTVKSRRDVQRSKNLTSRQKALKCTKEKSVTLVEPRVLIGITLGYQCNNVYWDWETASNDFMTHSQFISIALVEYERMGIQYNRLTPFVDEDGLFLTQSDSVLKYLHCYAALCMGFKLTYFWKDRETGERMAYVVPLVNKAHFKMFKCFNIPIFQYVAYAVKNYKFLNYITRSWTVLTGHPENRLGHSSCRFKHTYNQLGTKYVADFQHQGAFGWAKRKLAQLASRILSSVAYTTTADMLVNLKNTILSMFREIRAKLCETMEWVLDKLSDLGAFIITCATGFFEAFLAFTSESKARLIRQFRLLFSFDASYDTDVFVSPEAKDDIVDLSAEEEAPKRVVPTTVIVEGEEVPVFQAQGFTPVEYLPVAAVFASQVACFISGSSIADPGTWAMSFFKNVGQASRGAELTASFGKSLTNALWFKMSGNHLFDSEALAARIGDLCVEISEAEAKIVASARYGVVPQPVVAKLNSVYAELRDISIRMMSKQKTGQRTVADGLFAIVEESMQKCILLQAQSHSRVSPICIFLHGPTKQGKTVLTKSLPIHILEVFRRICKRNNFADPYAGVNAGMSVKAFDCTDLIPYFEGYANQFCVQLDEIYSSLNNEINEKWSRSLQAWLDKKPTPLTMAFDAKGKQFFTSPVVVCTSNSPAHVISTCEAEAYHRRIDFDINCESKYTPGSQPHFHCSFQLSANGLNIHNNDRIRPHDMFERYNLNTSRPFGYAHLVNMCAEILFERVRSCDLDDIPDFDDIARKADAPVPVKFGQNTAVNSVSTSMPPRTRTTRFQPPDITRSARPPPPKVLTTNIAKILEETKHVPLDDVLPPAPVDTGAGVGPSDSLFVTSSSSSTEEIPLNQAPITEVLENQGRIFYERKDKYYLDTVENNDDMDQLILRADEAQVFGLPVIPKSQLPPDLVPIVRLENVPALEVSSFLEDMVEVVGDLFDTPERYDPIVIQATDAADPVAMFLNSKHKMKLNSDDLRSHYKAYFEAGSMTVSFHGSLWNRIKSAYSIYCKGEAPAAVAMIDRSNSYRVCTKEVSYSWWPSWTPEFLTPFTYTHTSDYDSRLVRSSAQRNYFDSACYSYSSEPGAITAKACLRPARIACFDNYPCELLIDLALSDSEMRAFIAQFDGRVDWCGLAWLMFGTAHPSLDRSQLVSNSAVFGAVHAIALFLLESDCKDKPVEYYSEKSAIMAMDRIKDLLKHCDTTNFEELCSLFLSQSYLLATNWLIINEFYTRAEIATKSVFFYRKFVASSLGRFMCDAAQHKTEFLTNVSDEYHRKFCINLAVGAAAMVAGVGVVALVVSTVLQKTALVEMQGNNGVDYDKNSQDRKDVMTSKKFDKKVQARAGFMLRRMMSQGEFYDPILAKIQSCQYIIFQKTTLLGFHCVAHSISVHNNIHAFNKHVWQALAEDFVLCPVMDDKKHFVCAKSTCIVHYSPADRDVIYVQIPNALFGPALLRKHVPKFAEVQKYRSSISALVMLDKTTVDDKGEITENQYGWEPVPPICMSKSPLACHFNGEEAVWRSYYQSFRKGNAPGDCMTALASKLASCWKLFGGHMAGSPSSGAVTFVPFYAEDLDRILEHMKDSDFGMQGVCLGDPDPLMAFNADDMFHPVTEVMTIATSKNMFVETPFSDPEFELESPKGPAHVDNKAYDLASSTREEASEATRSMHPWAIREIYERGEHLMDGYVQMTQIPESLKNCRTLTPDEAVYGNGEHVASCDFTTSDGIRLKKEKLKKENLVDPEHPHSKRIIEIIWLYLNYFRSGNFTYAISADCLKNELRDWTRVHAWKTRIFYILDFIDCMLQKCAIGDFMCRLKQYLGGTDATCGIAAGRRHWAMLYEKFATCLHGIVSADIKHNDFIMHLFTLYVFVPWTWRFYPEAARHGYTRNLITWAYMANFMCIRFNRGKGWLMGSGNPSGGFITTHMNTIYNSLMQRLCFEYGCYKRGIVDYRNEWQFFVREFYSDDNLTASLKYEWWTLQELASTAKLLFGVTITDSDKGFDFGPNLPIVRVSYLSRAFYPNPKVPNLIHAPLKLDSLLPQLFWVRKAKGGDASPAHVLDQLQLNLNNIRAELLEYPREEAQRIYDIISKFIVLRRLPLVFDFFSEAERVDRTMMNQI
jgi:hypothetical protein